ncbi:hypothetical protein EJ03DRAFT_357157 [Teratosphaeria nubilosa]|uniref:GH16 domain-containing protein n=1 Tax=Teratosphaeria nubilosa TaxID=161662 RepID=A0A6G1LGE5_9PEZI|nr:hypothetical protein EJ03DRAFT_357157 [Teratosphaeria nubilosa]
MRTSPLSSRTSIVGAFALISTVQAQSIPGATFYNGSGSVGAASYQLVDSYDPTNGFFDKFNFYSVTFCLPTPSANLLSYVNETVAEANGFVSITSNNTAKMIPDHTNVWPRGGDGRPSVRIISDNTYTHGLFIADFKHMPWGCGTWPAYWLLGPNWPYNGEIDIIEGVNTIETDAVTLHTGPNCSIAGSGQLGTNDATDCNSANGGNGCGSTLSNTTIPDNYGDEFNSIQGGVYATEWTSSYIKTWFFRRGSIPSDITSGSPVPGSSAWGPPAVNAQGSCNIDSAFNNMSIIINIDFCGAWAGEIYESEYPNCPQNASAGSSLNSCVDFVGNNPANFTNAYFEINSIRAVRKQLQYQLSEFVGGSIDQSFQHGGKC